MGVGEDGVWYEAEIVLGGMLVVRVGGLGFRMEVRWLDDDMGMKRC